MNLHDGQQQREREREAGDIIQVRFPCTIMMVNSRKRERKAGDII